MLVKSKNNIRKLLDGGEDQDLYIAQTGATKTFAIERQVEEAYLNGKTIIHLSNAKNNLEQGFCMFKPQAKYHLHKLRFQEEKPQTHKMKRYIPFSNNIPYKDIYESEIFSLNIKNLDRINISFIFEQASETSSITVLNSLISNLKDNEGMFDLLYKLKKGEGNKKDYDLFNMEGGANPINVQTVIKYLSRFRNNPLVMPSNFEYNLDMKKILNDNSCYHVFDLQFMPDQKLKDFVQIYILNEILKAKSSGKVKREIVVVIDELKVLANANPLFEHQKVLNKLLANILSVCRSLGVKIISASQTYMDIDPQVRQSFSNVILGKTSAFQDINTLSQITGLDVHDRKTIFSLGKNQFILLSQDVDIGAVSVFNFHAPRHKHCERGENFEKFIKKYYPNYLKNHAKIKNYFKKHYKDQELNAKKLLKQSSEATHKGDF